MPMIMINVVVELATFPPRTCTIFMVSVISGEPLVRGPGMLLFIVRQCLGLNAFIEAIDSRGRGANIADDQPGRK